MDYYRTSFQSWVTWLHEQLNLPENGRLLDLGCGLGDLWQKSYLNHVDQLLCLSDLSVSMMYKVREIFKDNPAISCALINASVLPFCSASFANIFAFGLLDQLPSIEQALQEIRRVLQPGGLFYASAGGQYHLKEIRDLIKPFLPTAEYGGDPERFGLENGERVLAPFFRQVELRPYTDKLIFLDEDPLLAYALSEPSVRQQLTAEKLAAFKQHVAQELARKGKIQVTINKGLFIASLANFISL
jgi:ubiquinone/menaquinone biosynthesis C-methylase UbiE